jgi:hypothetical protein
MNKDIFTYILVFVILFLIGFYTHQAILSSKEIQLSFSLEKVYAFHAFFSVLVCLNLRWGATKEKVLPQLGFIYLGSLILKLVLFSILFYKTVLQKGNFTSSEKISLLIPVLIFLIIEVIFTSKILNRK